MAEVVAVFSIVNAIEEGLSIDIFTGGSTGGFVPTTCTKIRLDRYIQYYGVNTSNRSKLIP